MKLLSQKETVKLFGFVRVVETDELVMEDFRYLVQTVKRTYIGDFLVHSSVKTRVPRLRDYGRLDVYV